jgi:hypothetical protein
MERTRELEEFTSENMNAESSEILYRNQFILGPVVPDGYDNWKKTNIRDSLVATTHPTLDVNQVSFNGVTLTSLGYLLDPHHPRATDTDILESLSKGEGTFESIVARTASLGGRWVLIYDDGTNTFLLNDATGLRQVYYTYDENPGPVWCASQAKILAKLLNLQIDSEASEFIQCLEDYRKANPTSRIGFWWPGMGSPYKEVKHLPPNHYLDLNSGSKHRFFPTNKLEPISLDGAIKELTPLIRGMLEATSNRFDDLTMLITAGLDSRVLLAACRPFAKDISYLTIDYQFGNKADVSVAGRVLSALNLPHDITVANSAPSPEFRDLYEKHSLLVNDSYVANAESLLPFLARKRVAITGNNASIFTCYYRLPRLTASIKQLTPELLSRLTPEVLNHPYALQEFREWMDGLGNTYNYNVLDLFCWEQDAGNWLADWSSAYDLVWKDFVVPFNSREILVNFLRVEEKDRKQPQKELNKKLVSHMWPDVPLILGSDDDTAARRIKKAIHQGWRDIKETVELTFN